MTKKRKTIGEMIVGDVGYVLPSTVLYTNYWMDKWLDPAEPIYDAPGIGCSIRRTESGYRVRRLRDGFPSRADLEPEELKEAGYISVNDYE